MVGEWGVYQGGGLAIAADSFLAMDFRDISRLATFPMEEGAFASFNKVEAPYDLRVTLTRGGSDADRAEFIGRLYLMKKSIDLFEIITPEVAYISANLENYEYRRTVRSGQTLITAELYFKEVRITAGASNYNASQPSGSSPSSGGQVQGQ
jgi:hypothetical protein